MAGTPSRVPPPPGHWEPPRPRRRQRGPRAHARPRDRRCPHDPGHSGHPHHSDRPPEPCHPPARRPGPAPRRPARGPLRARGVARGRALCRWRVHHRRPVAGGRVATPRADRHEVGKPVRVRPTGAAATVARPRGAGQQAHPRRLPACVQGATARAHAGHRGHGRARLRPRQGGGDADPRRAGQGRSRTSPDPRGESHDPGVPRHVERPRRWAPVAHLLDVHGADCPHAPEG